MGLSVHCHWNNSFWFLQMGWLTLGWLLWNCVSLVIGIRGKFSGFLGEKIYWLSDYWRGVFKLTWVVEIWRSHTVETLWQICVVFVVKFSWGDENFWIENKITLGCLVEFDLTRHMGSIGLRFLSWPWRRQLILRSFCLWEELSCNFQSCHSSAQWLSGIWLQVTIWSHCRTGCRRLGGGTQTDVFRPCQAADVLFRSSLALLWGGAMLRLVYLQVGRYPFFLIVIYCWIVRKLEIYIRRKCFQGYF